MQLIDFAKSIALVKASIIFPTHQDGINVETLGCSVFDWANEVKGRWLRQEIIGSFFRRKMKGLL